MADTVKTEIFDLRGPALDWAVAKALGASLDSPLPYSTDWGVGGPIIEAHGIRLERDLEGHSEPARPWVSGHRVFWANGPTMLVAACRVLVMSRLNRMEIDVPAGLAGARAP